MARVTGKQGGASSAVRAHHRHLPQLGAIARRHRAPLPASYPISSLMFLAKHWNCALNAVYNSRVCSSVASTTDMRMGSTHSALDASSAATRNPPPPQHVLPTAHPQCTCPCRLATYSSLQYITCQQHSPWVSPRIEVWPAPGSPSPGPPPSAPSPKLHTHTS